MFKINTEYSVDFLEIQSFLFLRLDLQGKTYYPKKFTRRYDVA